MAHQFYIKDRELLTYLIGWQNRTLKAARGWNSYTYLINSIKKKILYSELYLVFINWSSYYVRDSGILIWTSVIEGCLVILQLLNIIDKILTFLWHLTIACNVRNITILKSTCIYDESKITIESQHPTIGKINLASWVSNSNEHIQYIA